MGVVETMLAPRAVGQLPLAGVVAARPSASARRRHDEALLTELVRAHRSWLLAYCLRLTGGDRVWAEDVLQETFERAWRHLDRLTADQGSVPGWLRRVAHNRAVDDHRARRSRPPEVALADHVDAPSPVSTDIEVLQKLVIADVLAALPAQQRQALEVTIMQDHTAAEAARILSVPIGTVKSRVFYGLRRPAGQLPARLGHPQLAIGTRRQVVGHRKVQLVAGRVDPRGDARAARSVQGALGVVQLAGAGGDVLRVAPRVGGCRRSGCRPRNRVGHALHTVRGAAGVRRREGEWSVGV